MTKPQFERVFDDTPVLVAYLFGSHAVGRAGPASDFDIAVLCAPELSSAERGQLRLELIGRLKVPKTLISQEFFTQFPCH